MQIIQKRDIRLVAHLKGKATIKMTTDEIMQLTRVIVTPIKKNLRGKNKKP